jgi:hypothetical protein
LGPDERVAVDVEDLQRQYSVWGMNALEWEPRRWVNIEGDEKLEFMPFGMGKFQCPAKGSFGPMLVGILVGCLVLGFEDGGVGSGIWEVVNEDGSKYVFGEKRVPLERGREAYAGLRLRRVGRNSRFGA